ncbi:hypothetical protein NLJ89_g815 [Agrocybe chaxingu]|uniref:alpha-1,2-Mannosidase n=1 Tax=Agrocybe chaxingu TaxID=84603 RepID=A0A9W8N1A9_9AGAR|nr:hypothetical protein NLJ89_g815 [Agrocybe chaxingu]
MSRRTHYQVHTNRPTTRNLLYGAVILLGLYGLFRTMTPYDVESDEWDSISGLVSPATWQVRAETVKGAFLHAYHGYEKYAAPHDELKPLSNGSSDKFNGWGVTVFDSLDTMLLMGLKEEYVRGLEIVKSVDFTTSTQYVPYFETIIRYLGGLLSAYALSKDSILIQRAEDMVKRLDPAFNTPTGIPFFSVDVENQQGQGAEVGILAEISSLQLEYTYLAKLTGKFEYYNRSATINRLFANTDLKDTGGMLPVSWNLISGKPLDTHLSVGAQADSAHEYLLKLYLLTGKTDRASLEMYNLKSLGIDLQQLGNERLYGYAGKGYRQLADYNLKDIHMWAAEGLAQTCYLTYADSPTGLGPDEMMIKYTNPEGTWTRVDGDWKKKSDQTHLWMEAVDRWKNSGSRGVAPGLAEKKRIISTAEDRWKGVPNGRDYMLRKSGYLLRPETVESLYLLWRITGDSKWRERGWAIFEAIEKTTRTASGYASLYSVETGGPDDSMPSYFLAETLKYLYLMCLDDDPISLDKWVFNTEAHPLPVFDWTPEEIRRFNVAIG